VVSRLAKELPQVGAARKAQAIGKQTFDRAVAALEQGDEVGAKRLFKEAHYNLGNALKAAPDSPNNLEMDARAMLHTGLYADVIQTTGRLLKVKPSSLEGFLLRGQAYLYQGEEEVAMQHFKEGYKSDPDHKALKKAYKDLKQFKKLRDKVESARGGGDWGRLLDLARDALELMHGEGGAGKPELDTLTVKLREGQCKAFAQLQRAAEAMACAGRVQQHDPESVEAFKWKCEALMQQQQWEAAKGQCDQMMQVSRVDRPRIAVHAAE
jgi:tetratricopeptide (TPR) repeat protein